MRIAKRVAVAALAAPALGVLLAVTLASAAEQVRPLASHDWPVYGHTPREERFSPLDQIDRNTVGRLGLAWSYDMGTRRGLEATPIVVDGILYTTGTWSVVHALDAATGKLLWRYDPKVPGSTARKACCDVVNRGVAVSNGSVYVGTLDGRLVSLDARTGDVRWEVLTVDSSRSYTITGAPRVVKGKVLIGNGGAELGVRGYLTAYDAQTGQQVWRFYTVPGPPDQPYEHPELEMAARTWSPDSTWETGLGGTVWDSMSFDAELDLLYVGVGNSSPYNRAVRSPGGGDNLFLASILALRPDTGRLVWHYQTTPAETWDYTATQQMILADLEIGGRVRKVLMQAPKNGFFYVLDRSTGELLSAQNFVPVSWATHIDLATGRPVEANADWSEETKFVTPGPPGGHSWQPMAFNPRTGLVYIPAMQTARPLVPDPNFTYRPGLWNTGEDMPGLLIAVQRLPIFRHCKSTQLLAWDPVSQSEVWRVDHDAYSPAGVLATAGGLVFQGTGGRFVAYSADRGTPLWESEVGVGIVAPPITYAIDGVQYVALMAGLGGGDLVLVPVPIENEGRLLVYRLDGQAPMPAFRPRVPGTVQVPPGNASPETIERGRDLYANHCLVCHGVNAANGGMMPDLRHSSPAVHDQWHAIVLGGTRQAKGMASFADVLDAERVDAIHAYVLHRAHYAPGFVERAALWVARRVCVPVEWLAD